MAQTDDRRPSLRRFYARLVDRAPWGLALVLGLVAIGLGVAITTKPFTSLGVLVVLVAAALVVTGVSEIASARSSLAWSTGIAWVAAGIAVAVWPGLTIRGLAILVGISLLVGGVLRIASGVRGTADERLITILSGFSRAVFGVLALSWPDVTLLVLALLVGPVMILFGLGQVASALWQRRSRAADERADRRWPTWLRLVGVSASLLVALGLLGISALIHRTSSQSPDAFYTAPSEVPDDPGALLRSEPFTRVPKGALGWRILYTTTRDDETPVLASALVLVPEDATEVPRPVVAWAHGTTGYASKCAPSLLPDPFAAGAMPALDEVLANGWAVVATDYIGLGTEGPHPYLIGDPSGRAVVDAVRAARRLDETELEDRTVVWGHSQGGGAALWTGIVAPRYAPDVDVIGVAAMAPAADLPAIFAVAKDTAIGKILGAYVISAYSEIYPDVDVDDYIRPAARTFVRETAARCFGAEALASIGTAITGESIYAQNPAGGPLGKRFEENVPRDAIEAPLLIAQGLTDPLIRPAEQGPYVDELCRAGQRLEYRTYAGFDHVGVVLSPDSPLIPDLVDWTQARLRGEPQPTGCETVER